MSRIISVIVCFVVILNFVSIPASRADETTLTLGDKHEGEIGGKMRPTPGVDFLGAIDPAHAPGQGYQVALTVKLKAGQAVTISARAWGDGRKVYIILRDRTGAPIAASKIESEASVVKIKQIADSGSHTIDVVSDRIGKFTLLVTTDEELSEKELEKKIEELEKELKDLKAKLKEKQNKKPH